MKSTRYKKKELNENDIVVLGVPFDGNSSYKRGPASAPVRIREALFSASSNMWTENAVDLGASSGWHIGPDIELLDEKTAFAQIEREIDRLLKRKSKVITLGGDHSITLPLVRAYARAYRQLNILHLDAHPDLYDELDGNRYSHACPFARIMEENLAVRLVQVGIRTLTGHQREQAHRFGVELIEMKNIDAAKKLSFDGPVYLSLDIDCLDPAYAPGVSHHEPGGMSTRDVLEIIQDLRGDLVGADIVEFNPERDLHGMTGMVAGKLLKELIGRML
jgi:agmatinase